MSTALNYQIDVLHDRATVGSSVDYLSPRLFRLRRPLSLPSFLCLFLERIAKHLCGCQDENDYKQKKMDITRSLHPKPNNQEFSFGKSYLATVQGHAAPVATS